MATTTTEEKAGSWESCLSPRALLFGIACSFVACCLAGWLLSQRNPFVGFERFLPHIAPDSLFYPTISQVRALACEKLDTEKIAVVVGGNSVTYGVGQRAEYLWTKRLQEELGEKYRVINLAMRGATPGEFGAVAAEVLSRDYPRLIYLAVLGGGSVRKIPDGSPPYRYFFWDAYYRDLLLHDPEREGDLRDACNQREHDADFAELRWQMRLDRFTHARDLWTSLAYERFSTVWCSLVGRSWWMPRKVYGDEERGGLVPFDSRYPPARDAIELAIVRYFSQIGPSLYDGPQAPVPEGLRAVFPAPCRHRTLVLLCHESPYYVRRLTPEETRTLPRGVRRGRALPRARGLRRPASRQGLHHGRLLRSLPPERGGRQRLAGDVTVKVRQMARDLGYVREERP